MQNKTAMQQLIDKLTKAKEACRNEAKAAHLNGVDSETAKTMYYVYGNVIKTATELLSVEREQIKDAVNQGYRDGEKESEDIKDKGDISEFSDADLYYSQTYKQ